MHPRPTESQLLKTRRHLPHWELEGATYFITWRCIGGLELEPEDRDIVARNLRHWDGQRYLLLGATVMPDHVHVILKLLPGEQGPVSLSTIVHTAKGYAGQQINKRRGRRGPVWQDERFDRIVRDEAEFIEKLNYVRNNAVARGLVADPDEYPWLLCQSVI